MGKRSPVSTTDKEIEALSLEQLNAQIAKALWGYENSGTSQGRKAFFKRLVWLEKHREAAHGIIAKQRRFGAP
ncbi:hypothetical protein [Mesorhizobium sp. B1-1-8]|uniref:hypothetical protein n=1 Tax=Mesorhizobium sp. B1-1-8 TaxID=2589976 RepID=UPI001126979E|nr:hypothetical protein [Mesorhizobium sp. B1-1-8]UCI05358.1 hypothetical protein FJ974_16000 [Mesorhizobium sp. B1-1-8]